MSFSNFLKNLIRYRFPLKTLAITELKTTVTNTKLGALWWILDPLIMMAIYYFMISVVFQRGGPGYHLFALIGIVSWGTFSRTLLSITSSIKSNKSLLISTSVPLEIFTFSPILPQAFIALIGYVIIIVWVFVEKYLSVGLVSLLSLLKPLEIVLQIFPILFLILLYAYGIGLFFAVTSIFLPDLKKVVTYALRGGFFLTPILYSPEKVLSAERFPDFFKTVFLLNPIGYCVTSLRNIILNNEPIAIHSFFCFFVAGVFLSSMALLILSKSKKNVCKYI